MNPANQLKELEEKMKNLEELVEERMKKLEELMVIKILIIVNLLKIY